MNKLKVIGLSIDRTISGKGTPKGYAIKLSVDVNGNKSDVLEHVQSPMNAYKTDPVCTRIYDDITFDKISGTSIPVVCKIVIYTRHEEPYAEQLFLDAIYNVDEKTNATETYRLKSIKDSVEYSLERIS